MSTTRTLQALLYSTALVTCSAAPAMADPVSATIAAIITYAGGASLATAALVGGLALVSSIITQALAPKPGGSPLQDTSRSNQVNQPIVARRVVYGRTKLSGGTPLISSTSEGNFLHSVVVLATHEIEGFGTIYINGIPILQNWIDGSGNVTQGRFKDKLRILMYNGLDDQPACPELVVDVPEWTDSHRLRGCAYIYLRYTKDSTLYQSSLPSAAADIKGKKLFDPRTLATTWNANAALAVNDWSVLDRFGMGMQERPEFIDSNSIIAAANICDEFVAVKEDGAGVLDIHQSGAHEFQLAGEVLKFYDGDKVRVGLTTGAYPTNITSGGRYYVIVVNSREYVADTEKYENDASLYPTIQLASTLEDAMAGIPLGIGASAGTYSIVKTEELRYTTCNEIKGDEDRGTVLSELVQAMAGETQKTGLTRKYQAGSYITPTITITEDDFVSPLVVSTRTSRSARINTVRGTYISPSNFDQATDYPTVQSATYLADDLGREAASPFDLRFTRSHTTAQRIARIRLEANRRQIRITVRTHLRGLLHTAGDSVMVTSDRYGFASKVFKVEQWKLVPESDGDSPVWLVELTLREYDASIYSYNALTDELDMLPAVRTNLPDISQVANVQNILIDSGADQLEITGSGSLVSRIRLDWDAPTVDNVQFYELSFRKLPEAEYTTAIISGQARHHFIVPVQDGQVYDIRMRALSLTGIYSKFTSVPLHTVSGKLTAPPTPDSFTVARLADGTRRFDFELFNLPADVRVGGGYKLRYKLGTGTVAWAVMTPMHTGIITDSPYETVDLEAGTYTFAIKAVDSTDNESADPLFIIATLGDPPLRDAIYQERMNPLWPGTITNGFVSTTGIIVPNSTGDWTDLAATWTDVGDSWIEMGDFETTITYQTNEIDLGFDLAFQPSMTLEADGTSTTQEYRIGSAADGGAISAWTTLAPIQLTDVRYIQFRVTATDVTAPPTINSMLVLLLGESRQQAYDDINITTEANAWFTKIATGHFKVTVATLDANIITQASITALQNVGAGWTWEIISKANTIGSSTAAEFKIYDNTNTLADAVIDLQLKFL